MKYKSKQKSKKNSTIARSIKIKGKTKVNKRIKVERRGRKNY